MSEPQPTKQQLHHEIHLISSYASFKYSRIVCIFSLCISEIVFRAFTSFYMIVIFILLPSIFSYILSPLNAKGSRIVYLQTIAKRYHFSNANLQGEQYCFYIILFLLVLWKKKAAPISFHGITAFPVPTWIILFYVVFKIISLPLIYFKIKKDLANCQ